MVNLVAVNRRVSSLECLSKLKKFTLKTIINTLSQLIERFYQSNGGSIELDGVPLEQLDLKWLRSKIGYVQQEPFLFNKTIRDNLAYGIEGVNDVDIIITGRVFKNFSFLLTDVRSLS